MYVTVAVEMSDDGRQKCLYRIKSYLVVRYVICVFQHTDGDTLAELEQAKQHVLRADVVVVKAVCLAAGQVENLLGSGGKVIHT